MKLRLAAATLALTLCTLFVSTSLQAQTAQASMAKDAATLSTKFTGLAKVMAGKYDWTPSKGVRSVGEVFNLIVMENGVLQRTLTGAAAPAGPRPAPITDADKMQEALKASYESLQTAINGLSDAELKTAVKMFGHDFTKEEAARMLLSDQHEHLGQSIAYARSNNVVPPWSK